MTWTEWLIFLLIIQVIHGLGTWKLYEKAGQKAWQAFVPVYNAVILMKIINRPLWWVILLFLPVVNIIMFIVVWVETARSFGKNSPNDTVFAIISLGFYNYYLNYAADVKYIENRSLQPKSSSGEWTSSILFAIVAATIVHTYFMQPFTIPSSSLEKSLLVGDFLFVSKFHYGARVPMSTIAAPMVHDTIPGLKIKSYAFNDDYNTRKTSWINKLQLPYLRLPGFEKIKRNEIVVFNQPADTLLDMNDFHPDRNYYKPIDKKTNLVKRCVGLPGDTLEVRNGYVYINGKKNELPDRAKLQFSYYVKPKTHQFDPVFLASRYDITDGAYPIDRQISSYYLPAVSDEAVEKFKNNPNVANIKINKQIKGERDPNIFPHDPNYNWNVDFFGPLYLPKKGATIALDLDVLPLYKRAISEYEDNTLSVNGNQILINGEVATSYTFKQDYYWMMGDNRHNSIDARAWGLVPYDHVLGKPVFIWMSWNGLKPRWERFFTTVHGTKKASSFFLPFVVLLIVYIILNKLFKKNKENNLVDDFNESNLNYSPIQNRIKAATVDSIILIVAMYFVSELFSQIGEISNTIKIITTCLIFFLYDPLMTSIYGGTIGHSVSKITVRKDDESGNTISFPVALGRFVLKFSLGWISLLSISGSSKKKAIHDKFANSIVINKYKN